MSLRHVSPSPSPSSSPLPSASPSPSPSPSDSSLSSPSCPHFASLSLPQVVSSLRDESFTRTISSSSSSSLPSLPCSQCRQSTSLASLWLCLECPSPALRCGRDTPSRCALQHASRVPHRLVLSAAPHSRLLWCYECDAELLDQQKGVTEVRRLLVPNTDKDSDATVRSNNDGETETELEKEEDASLSWEQLLVSSKGGQSGLSNLGNTCFMNASLQSLLHIPAMIAFLGNLSHLPVSDVNTRLIVNLAALVQKTWSGQYSVIHPGEVYRDITIVNPYFRGYAQHDAQELLRCLLEKLHEGLKRCEQYDYRHFIPGQGTGEEQLEQWEKEKQALELERERLVLMANQMSTKERKKKEKDKIKGNLPVNGITVTRSVLPSTSVSQNGYHSHASSQHNGKHEASSLEHTPAKKSRIWLDHSIISDTFAGLLESRIRCGQCGMISTVYDQYYDLSLEIPKDALLKRIAAERGAEAASGSNMKQSWVGSLFNYIGMTSTSLSLETCIVENTPVLIRMGLQQPIQLVHAQQSLLSLRHRRSTCASSLLRQDSSAETLVGTHVHLGPLGVNMHHASNCVRVHMITGRTIECTSDHRVAVRSHAVSLYPNSSSNRSFQHAFRAAEHLQAAQFPDFRAFFEEDCDLLVCGPGGTIDDQRLDSSLDSQWRLDFSPCSSLPSLEFSTLPLHSNPQYTGRDRCLAFARMLGLIWAQSSFFCVCDSVELSSLVDVREWQLDCLRVCGLEAKVERSAFSFHVYLPTALKVACVSLHGVSLSTSFVATLESVDTSIGTPSCPSFLFDSPKAIQREFLAAALSSFARFQICPGIPLVPNKQSPSPSLSPVSLTLACSNHCFSTIAHLLNLFNVMSSMQTPLAFSAFSVHRFSNCCSKQLLVHDVMTLFQEVSFRYHANAQYRLAIVCEHLALLNYLSCLVCSQNVPSSSLASASNIYSFLALINISKTLFDVDISFISMDQVEVPVYYLPVVLVEPLSGSFLVHDLTVTSSSSADADAYDMHNFLANSVVVHNCLHAFCTSDRLVASDQYRCDVCKVKVDASKTLSLHTLPEVLMLHLKRFSYTPYFNKISRQITFPVQKLDMTPFLSEDARNWANSEDADPQASQYDLFAIIRHIGGSSGHYIAYCKNHVTGHWSEYDDRTVTVISEKRLNDIEPYVLFYQRRHSEGPMLTMLERIKQATLQCSPSADAPLQTRAKPVRYLSKEFVKRVRVLKRPEPLDNRDLLCIHGVPYDVAVDGGSIALPLSVEGWNRLHKLYGGGPLINGHHFDCTACQLPVIRAREKKRITQLDHEATYYSKPTDPFYLIYDPWLQQWREFMAGAEVRPGPISNHLMLDEKGAPQEGLLKLKHYRGLHGTVWDELYRCYGGGPAIVRDRLDIYDQSPSTMSMSPDRPELHASNKTTDGQRIEINWESVPHDDGDASDEDENGNAHFNTDDGAVHFHNETSSSPDSNKTNNLDTNMAPITSS